MENEMIEFAKWFIHSRRKEFKYQDHINAADFASNLMQELCAKSPFEKHKLIEEYNNYKILNGLVIL